MAFVRVLGWWDVVKHTLNIDTPSVFREWLIREGTWVTNPGLSHDHSFIVLILYNVSHSGRATTELRRGIDLGGVQGFVFLNTSGVQWLNSSSPGVALAVRALVEILGLIRGAHGLWVGNEGATIGSASLDLMHKYQRIQVTWVIETFPAPSDLNVMCVFPFMRAILLALSYNVFKSDSVWFNLTQWEFSWNILDHIAYWEDIAWTQNLQSAVKHDSLLPIDPHEV